MISKQKDLRNFIGVLRKRRKVAIAVFVSIVLTTVLGTMIATPLFEGKVQIIIERVEPSDLMGTNRYQTYDPEFEKTQIQLIRSHAVARRVVDIINLEDDFEKLQSPASISWLNSIRQQIGSLLPFSKDEPELPASESSDKFETTQWSQKDLQALSVENNLSVQTLQGSHITEIRYTSPNPRFAAMVANIYVKAYLEETLDMKLDATRRNLGWMTEKADDEKLKLQATEKNLQKYMEQHNLVTLEDRIAILPETLSQLGGDLVRAEAKTQEAKLLYDKVRAVANDLDAAESVLSVSEGTTLDILRAQILKAEQYIMELSGKYGSQHPVMLKAAKDLDVLKKKRRQEVKRIIDKVRNQYELALSNERSIRASRNQSKSEAIDLNEKYVEYSALKREIETNRQLYDALLTKIKNQSITGETRPVNIWIVENAKVPKQPVKPNVKMNLMMGFVLGLCCSIGCAYLVDQLDNRIKSSEGVSEALGLPYLGSVSFNHKADSMKEVVRTAPRSEFAESYNALRTTLLLSSADSPPKRILVTSSISGEGKTTTAVNLAMTMAKSDSRVLLIDADLRKPQIHKILKLRNTSGLSSYLAGAAGKSILNKGPHENLVVVPAGPIPPNPYELLNSSRMSMLLENLGQDFDVIICDTPPTLSVADSRLLSRLFDGVIMVTRAGLTTYPMARASIDLLNDVNARILGVFINAVKFSDQESYYRYYSSYLDETEKPEEGKLNIKTSLEPAVGKSEYS